MKAILFLLSASLLAAAEPRPQVGQLSNHDAAARTARFTPSTGDKPGTSMLVALQSGDAEIAWTKPVRCTLVQRDGKLSAEGVSPPSRKNSARNNRSLMTSAEIRLNGVRSSCAAPMT